MNVASEVPGLGFTYFLNKQDCGAQLYIDQGKESQEDNKAIFDQLFAVRQQIETAVRHDMVWDRLERRRASRIRVVVEGGYSSSEDEWPDIQEQQVAGLNALAAALRPQFKNLRFGN